MDTSLAIRLVDDAGFEACELMKAELFGTRAGPERLAEVRPVRELDRMYAAYAGPEVVGSMAANSSTNGGWVAGPDARHFTDGVGGAVTTGSDAVDKAAST